MRTRLLRAALILAAVAVSACGKRGDPLPPIRPLPGRIVDLVARRVDDRVELRFTVPATNNDGTTPSVIDRIEVYRMMTTEDATSPSAVVLTSKKNLIGQITVRRPAPPEEANGKDKTSAAAPPKDTKPAAPTAAEPAGPAPGELAIYTDTTPTDTFPASAVRHYMLIGWGGKQEQKSAHLVVPMAPTAPPRPVEDLTADFDASQITVKWVGPPLLFLPVQRPGSALPSGFLPLATKPAPGQLPIATMPKASALPTTAATSAATGTTPIATGTASVTTGTTPVTGTTTGQTPPPGSTAGATATGATTPPQTATAPGMAQGGLGARGAGPGMPGAMPGLPGMGAAGAMGAAAVSVGPQRGYRVIEVDESGHELTPNGPLAPVTSASQLTLPVVFDKTRCFVVRTVETRTSVVMESAAVPPICVTPKDTFPPPAPTELRAFGGETGVVLTWTGVEASDLAGYIVLRGEGAGDNMQPLNTTPLTDTTFSDTKVKSGVTYVYAVIAVDSSPQHNPSAQSNKQTIVAR